MLADQPFLTAAVVARVRAAPGPAARATSTPARPAIRSCCAARCSARAGELHGDRGFRGLLDAATEVECGDLADPRDIDTRADLEVVRR